MIDKICRDLVCRDEVVNEMRLESIPDPDHNLEFAAIEPDLGV